MDSYLLGIIDIAWCVAIALISLKVFHIFCSRILNFASIIFIEVM